MADVEAPGQGDATGTEEEGTDSAPVDEVRQAILDALSSELGDAVVGSEIRGNDLWVRVRPDAWRRAAEACRRLGFDYFCFLSGIDWMPHTWPNPKVEGGGAGVESVEGGEDEGEVPATDQSPPEAQSGFETEQAPEPDAGGGWATGFAGGDSRFQVLARLYSTSRLAGVTLKADLDEATPRVETWSEVYPGADWHERETWEMYGFDFAGHPNLVHLYLPSEFEGFPLRKDFPLLSREVKPWPGLVDVEPMPGEADAAGDGAADEAN